MTPRTLQAAQKAVTASGVEYHRATALRDALLASASSEGHTYRALARIIGTSHTVVGACISRHNQQRSNRP